MHFKKSYGSPILFLLFVISIIHFTCLHVQNSSLTQHKEKKQNSIPTNALMNSAFVLSNQDSFTSKSLRFLFENAKSHNNDSVEVSIDNLTKSVNDALLYCETKLLNGEINFDDFCEFVLPYRIAEENIEDWRMIIKKQFGGFVDSMRRKQLSDVEISSSLNNKIREGFVFAHTKVPGSFKNWTQLHTEKKGNCIEMSHLIVYPLRTFGIPVSIDFTICWGNNNGYGHTWNALVLKNNIIPFMGMESNPDGIYSPFYLIRDQDPRKTTYRLSGKVFRKTFSPNLKIPKNDPLFQDQKHFKDVTAEYFDVIDLIVPTKSNLDNEHYYICVYNNGNWVPIYYGEARQDSVIFLAMATNMLYMPIALNQHQESLPLGAPQTINAKGKIHVLEPNFLQTIDIKVKTTQSIVSAQLNAIVKIGNWFDGKFNQTMKEIATGKGVSKPINRKGYELFYWNSKWISAGSSIANKEEVIFNNIPSNALYKIATSESDGNERVFTYDSGKQIWW